MWVQRYESSPAFGMIVIRQKTKEAALRQPFADLTELEFN